MVDMCCENHLSGLISFLSAIPHYYSVVFTFSSLLNKDDHLQLIIRVQNIAKQPLPSHFNIKEWFQIQLFNLYFKIQIVRSKKANFDII